EQLDVVVQPASVDGEGAVAVQEPALLQTLAGVLPLLVGESPMASEGVGGGVAPRRRQDVGLASIDFVALQGGDVPVATVLAQEGGGVPQRGQRLLGPFQRGVGG